MLDPITKREVPRDCRNEPSYPGAEHVVYFSIGFPDMTAHRPHPDCDGEPSGHLISECGVFRKLKGIKKMNIKRVQFGKWRFAYSFGRYKFGIHREAKCAGSVSFGFGMLTYLKKGKYQPLPQGALFTN